jgi:hypothetical protein
VSGLSQPKSFDLWYLDIDDAQHYTTFAAEETFNLVLYTHVDTEQLSLLICCYKSGGVLRADPILALGDSQDISHGRMISCPNLCHLDLLYEPLTTTHLPISVPHIYLASKHEALKIPSSNLTI